MDPDRTLAEMVRLTDLILTHDGEFSRADAVLLAEHADALDDWLRRGGWTPARWKLTLSAR